MLKKIIPLCALLFSITLLAQSKLNKESLTDAQFKTIYANSNVPVCLWLHLGTSTREQISKMATDAVKTLEQECDTARKSIKTEVINYEGDRLDQRKATNFRDPNWQTRYKQLFPEWEDNLNTRLIAAEASAKSNATVKEADAFSHLMNTEGQ